MRRMLAMLFATGLGISVVQPTVLAADNIVEVLEADVEKDVNSLSIDTVVERGLKRNSVLLLLDYQMEILDNQKSQTELDRDNTKSDLDEAIRKRREMREQRDSLDQMIGGLTGDMDALSDDIDRVRSDIENLGPDADEDLIAELNDLLTGYESELGAIGATIGESEQAKGSLTQGIEGMVKQIEALEDAIIQLDLAINKLAIGEVKLEFETEETKILMEMMLKSNYIQLYSMKEQQVFQELMTEQVEKEINAVKRRVELGLESPFELKKALRNIENQERDLQQLEKDFQRQLAKLALDIGISYHEDIELLPIELEELSPVQRRDVNTLIERSYALKKSDQDLKTAKLDVEHADSKGTEFQIRIAELNQKVAEENRRQLIIDSKKYIDDLYFDAEKGYQDYATKARNLYNAESDYQKLQRQYDLGLVSKYQYEQADAQLKQATFELDMSKIAYYMLLEQVDNMHKGVLR